MNYLAYAAILVYLFDLSKTQINLTRNGTAIQSSSMTINGYTYRAHLAIDGNKANTFQSGSCSITNEGYYTAWWMLSFNVDVFVTDVAIIYRLLTLYRFTHYELYVSNTTVPSNGKPTGHLCYQHPGQPDPSPIENVTCNAFGKNVIVYNHRNWSQIYPGVNNNQAFLELCDVKVYGCLKGWSGYNCTEPCPDICIDKQCFPSNKTCVLGCYRESCLNDYCHSGDYSCDEGCKPELAGRICDEFNIASKKNTILVPNSTNQNPSYVVDGDRTTHSCVITYGKTAWVQIDLGGIYTVRAVYLIYRLNDVAKFHSEGHAIFISNTSGIWENLSPLNNNSGDFPLITYDVNPVVVGKYLFYVADTKDDEQAYVDICEIEVVGCLTGKYGKNCNKSCPINCGGPCDLDTGLCVFGCKDGWKGISCENACISPNFGNECKHTCHCNNSQQCININGTCPDGECEIGWSGSNCSLECQRGTYGHNCIRTCRTCYNSFCDRFEGNCTFGCTSGYSGPRCKVLDSKKDDGNDYALIIGVICSVVLVILVAIALICILRRKSKSHLRNSTKQEGHIQLHSTSYDGFINRDGQCENDYAEIRPTKAEVQKKSKTETKRGNRSTDSSKHIYKNQALDTDIYDELTQNDDEQCQQNTDRNKILVADFPKMIKDKEFVKYLQKAFEALPEGYANPKEECQKYKTKNRFQNEDDHSRDILQGKHVEGYFTASLIDSFEKEKAYIATEDPLENTFDGFWQMVWQQNVNSIIMIRNLAESGQAKFAKYWPESSTAPLKAGDYEISLVEETMHTMYVYRKMKLNLGKLKRVIHQFNFTEWGDSESDFKIDLIDFYRKVKHMSHIQTGPLLVHGSNGIGQTAMFIAIDAIYENSKKTGYIDVLEYMRIMRRNRLDMIETFDQLKDLCEVLIEILIMNDTTIKMKTFNEHFETLKRNQMNLKLEFKKLVDVKKSYTSKHFLSAHSGENAEKNASKTILPHDSYRPHLKSFERTRNDYINAVFIPGNIAIGNRSFVTTQYPIQDTVVDFWTMVYDYDCTTVVLLENSNKKVILWPGNGGKFDFQRFSLKHHVTSSQLAVTLTLKLKEKNDDKIVNVLRMEDWTDQGLPSSMNSILELVQSVLSLRHPVVVVCNDGCHRSGLFVALCVIIEKMKMDHEVDVFNTVRKMQIRRPEFVSNLAQYEYCYLCVKEYLDGDYLHMNTT